MKAFKRILNIPVSYLVMCVTQPACDPICTVGFANHLTETLRGARRESTGRAASRSSPRPPPRVATGSWRRALLVPGARPTEKAPLWGPEERRRALPWRSSGAAGAAAPATPAGSPTQKCQLGGSARRIPLGFISLLQCQCNNSPGEAITPLFPSRGGLFHQLLQRPAW